jgi:hypothetical protein
LARIDETKGPEHAKHIYTYIDPQSGMHRETSPMLRPPQLVLAPDQVKGIRVRYEELRWFHPHSGTRAPEPLSDVADSGEFDLSVSLELAPGAPPMPVPTSRTLARTGPIRVRIVVRIS